MATARRRWSGRQVTVTSEQVSFDDYRAGHIPVGILNAARALQEAGFNSRSLK